MTTLHPHTKALAELLAAVSPFTPSHSGACIDFQQKHWPVSEESCKCNQDSKRFYRATRDARASLDYDTPPATNEERHNWRISSVCRELDADNKLLRRVADLANDAVESGAIDECYLSLLRVALTDLLPNAIPKP